MKLQILIPQYKETDDILKPMLDSIELQQNVDFNDIGVIIVNDGSDVHLSKDFLDSYSYKIDYFFEKHRGVSATRNSCLDHATAEYVMFCDADDMFFNMCGIWMIFREIDMGVFDSLVSVFVEETRDPVTKTPLYINREMDSTFVHGKVHRRQYLIDKNIRWNEKLTIHEDSYFNIQTANLSTNVKYCQSPFYLTLDIFNDYFMDNQCLPVVRWQYDLQHAYYYHIVSYNTEHIFAITAFENEGSTPILGGQYFNFCSV